LTGIFTNAGTGTVLLNTGFVNCEGYDFNGNFHMGLTLNFAANIFQWTGGGFENASLTNDGFMNLTNGLELNGTYFYNSSTVNMDNNCIITNDGNILNNIGATFKMGTNTSVLGGESTFFNYGLLQISAGAGLAQITSFFANYDTTVEMDSGTLAFNKSAGNYFSNSTFLVQSGAQLDLSVATGTFTNQILEIEGALTGSGGGTVLINSGTVYSEDQATLSFPGSMFQWQGGALGGESSFLTNLGTINISGPVGLANIANSGAMIQSGAGSIVGDLGILNNNVGGVYDIQNDNGVTPYTINNYGLFEKTGGTNTSVVAASYFYNYGPIQAASGTLSFTGEDFFQEGGTLQITPAITFGPSTLFYLYGGTVTGLGLLGGNGNNSLVETVGGVLMPGNPFGTLTAPGGSGIDMESGAAFTVMLGGPGLFSQLAVSNAASLGGTLHVGLANGYTPAPGTQFQILSCASLSGVFSATNVPPGISVNYSNNGVFLMVNSPAPVQINNPRLTTTNVNSTLATNFTFVFGTQSNQLYTIQQNTNLATTNWTFYTNITGNGSIFQFFTPFTNIPELFFRVVEP
jgi:hypothetical protein